jgi:hypothetical protein
MEERRVKDVLSFLVAQMKFLETKPEIGTQSCARAARRQNVIDAATQRKNAIQNEGPCQNLEYLYSLSLRSLQKLKIYQPLTCIVLSIVRVNYLHMKSHNPILLARICHTIPCRFRSLSGTGKMPREQITVPNCSDPTFRHF